MSNLKIVHTINEVREFVKACKDKNLSIGLVTTMGYLHEGHKSLIDRARKENDIVIVSIFVNPTQFGPNEDLESYPRDLNKDAQLCENSHANLIFNPEPSEMYLDDACTFVTVKGLTDGLCGAKRPVHFRGVCTVVSKFFNIVTPTRAYFGEKDAQQLAVIRKMVKDLNFNVEIVGCPIVREEDGLAKSSRNTYLSDEERKDALCLNKSLKIAKALLENGETHTNAIIEAIKKEINKVSSSKIDYIEIVDTLSLKPVSSIDKSVLVAIAVYIGKTRLIDNFTFKKEEK